MTLYFKKQYGIPTPKAISELGTAYKFVTGGAVDETEKDLMSMTFHDLFDNVSAGVCVCVCARVTTAARVTLIMQSPCPVSTQVCICYVSSHVMLSRRFDPRSTHQARMPRVVLTRSLCRTLTSLMTSTRTPRPCPVTRLLLVKQLRRRMCRKRRLSTGMTTRSLQPKSLLRGRSSDRSALETGRCDGNALRWCVTYNTGVVLC